MARFFTRPYKDVHRGTHVRIIPEGKGGTFKLSAPPPANSDSPASTKARQDNPLSTTAAASQLQFGTRNCYTCVGLCFPIPDTERIFVAHINAFVREPIEHPELDTNVTRHCSAEEGLAIQRDIRNGLRQRFKKGLWDVDKIDKSKVEIMCRWPADAVERMTGSYVVAAIREFLSLPGDWNCDRRSHGFLCDPQSGAVQVLPSLGFEQEWFKVRTWEQVVGGEVVTFTAIDEKAEGLEEWRVGLYRNSQVGCSSLLQLEERS